MAAQAGIAGWSLALEELHGRIAHRFARSEARERVERYLSRLLRLLNSAKWDADLVRDDLREYVVEHLGDDECLKVVGVPGYAPGKRGARDGIQEPLMPDCAG